MSRGYLKKKILSLEKENQALKKEKTELLERLERLSIYVESRTAGKGLYRLK